MSYFTPSGLSHEECRARILETVGPIGAETVTKRRDDYLELMDPGGVSVRGCAACGVLAFDAASGGGCPAPIERR